MAITESKYLKARQIVREYELQEREKYLIEKAKPCPSCGSKTDDNGDCRKCGIMFITSCDVDDNGNTLYLKPAKLHGRNTILTIVVRSDNDVKKSRHPKYKLLVP